MFQIRTDQQLFSNQHFIWTLIQQGLSFLFITIIIIFIIIITVDSRYLDLAYLE